MRSAVAKSPKKSYASPRLTVYGTVRDLTKSKLHGSGSDHNHFTPSRTAP
jgi:hypothetical protein